MDNNADQLQRQYQEAARLLRLMCDNVPDMIWAKDKNGVYLFANQAICDNLLLASDTSEPIGKDDMFFALRARAIHPERADWHTFGELCFNSDEIVLESGEAQRFEEFGNVRGELLVLDVYKALFLDEHGNVLGTVGCGRDITREKKIEAEAIRQREALRESEHKYHLVADNTADWEYWLSPSDEVLYMSPSCLGITGYGVNEFTANPGLMSAIIHPDDQAEYEAHRHAHNANAMEGETEFRILTKSGETRWINHRCRPVFDVDGSWIGIRAGNRDVTRRYQSEARLDHLARHDPLTALPNRLMFTSRLEHALDSARREGKRLAMLLLDFDRFKDINDSFGHATGDELLQQAATRLSVGLHEPLFISRLGGDEFAILIENLGLPQDAARAADEIIAALSPPFLLSGNGIEITLTTSIGIALHPEHGSTAQDLLQQADAALYRAKAAGGDRYQYFTEEFTREARERMALEAALRRAIEKNELRVHFQPQMDISSNELIGAEALVRWQHAEAGLIPPLRFIPIAEQTGLINAIGTWVLRETCRQGKTWLDAGLTPITLAVNLSPYQVRNSDIAAVTGKILAETGFPPKYLELELTESALMDHEEEAVEMMHRIRNLGVRLALDDFGTGYSSLAYLKRFPLDVLKIDKSFIDDIPLLRDDMEIAASIIAMGHILRFKVLAEGVETENQLAFLAAQGCDQYQGFLKSQPLPADEFEKKLMRALL